LRKVESKEIGIVNSVFNMVWQVYIHISSTQIGLVYFVLSLVQVEDYNCHLMNPHQDFTPLEDIVFWQFKPIESWIDTNPIYIQSEVFEFILIVPLN